MSNSEEQLEFLYKKFYDALYYYCMSFVKNEEDASEIINDTFMSVWKRREMLSLNEELKSYLYRIVHNKSINFIKKKRMQFTEVEELQNFAHVTDSTPFEVLHTKEVEAKVAELINELPARCKMTFLLSRKEGLSYKQIAEVMDITPKTVENQIAIAIKSIKAGLEDFRNDNKLDSNGLNALAIIIASALANYF